jgi:hypothetical protein
MIPFIPTITAADYRHGRPCAGYLHVRGNLRRITNRRAVLVTLALLLVPAAPYRTSLAVGACSCGVIIPLTRA